MLKGSFLVTTCVGILTGLIHWLKIIKYHINRQYNIIIKSYQPAAQTYPDPNPKLKKRQHCHTMGIDLCWRISLTHWGRIFIFYFNYSAWNCSKYQLSTPVMSIWTSATLGLEFILFRFTTTWNLPPLNVKLNHGEWRHGDSQSSTAVQSGTSGGKTSTTMATQT